jgi:outer membrane protein OmpA-like peptidoglycan-associated protein
VSEAKPQVSPQPKPKKLGAALVGGLVGVAFVLGATLAVGNMVHGANERILHPEAVKKEQAVAVADDTEAPYCTPAFKQVLQRVLNACGLVGSESRRGCQPADVKTFASISDADFNALFTPLKDRGSVLMFDEGVDELDPGAKKLLEEKWLDRKGARYFFVVARASKTGNVDMNRALSHRRANSVMLDLQGAFHDPDLDKQVGLLWLGNEFAQLDKNWCDWPTSRDRKACTPEAVNRSAFVSWVDCRL